jgi:hypothetical protein
LKDKSWILDTGYSIPVAGCWLLVTGCGLKIKALSKDGAFLLEIEKKYEFGHKKAQKSQKSNDFDADFADFTAFYHRERRDFSRRCVLNADCAANVIRAPVPHLAHETNCVALPSLAGIG